jgi:hypothetical protein
MMRVLCFVLIALGCQPCRPPDDYYDFRVGYGDESYSIAGRVPMWGGTTPSLVEGRTLRRAWVGFPAGRVPTRSALEFERDGSLVEVPFRTVRDLFHRDGPPNRDAQEFDLEALPDGDYVLRHRRSSVTSDLRTSFSLGNPWTMVDGEQVVETRLVLGRSSADAGSGADAR